MLNLEKTILRLECCTQADNKGYPKCERCPYADEKLGTCDAVRGLMKDALSLLKAQEPRVLTLDEAAEADTCYIEYACGEVKPAFLRFSVQVAGYKSYKVMTDNNHHYFDGDKYGIILRCWTSRPTDEQREATPWKN